MACTISSMAQPENETMSALSDFIGRHRRLFTPDHNNVFAFAFGKAETKLRYLDIIQERYEDVSRKFVANSTLFWIVRERWAMARGTRRRKKLR